MAQQNTSFSDTMKVEWEEESDFEESDDPDRPGRESFFQKVKKRQLKTDCEKQVENPAHHLKLVPYKKALDIVKGVINSDLDPDYTNMLMSLKATNDRDETFLRPYIDSIVFITVKKQKKDGRKLITVGTGFVIKDDPHGSGLRVITNFHNVFNADSDAGGDKAIKGKLVDKDKVRVIFYHDGCHDPVVCNVIELTPYQSPNERTQSKKDGTDQTQTTTGSTLRSVDRKVLGETTDPADGDIKHLDYIILYVDENGKSENGDFKVEVKEDNKIRLEESARPQGLHKIIQIYPPSKGEKLLFMCVGHPHGASKHLSFGELATDSDGKLVTDPDDMDREWAESSHVSVRHTCPTCPGSSGSPLFAYHLRPNKVAGEYTNNKDVINNNLAWFLHHIGFTPTRDENEGQAVSFQAICKHIRKKKP